MKRMLLAMALLLLTSGAWAEDSAPLAGVYSDMYFNHTRGSLLGVEIFVVPSPQGYHVLFQGAGGRAETPVLVPATVEENRIEFTLPERTGYIGKFTGIFQDEELVGSFQPAQINHVTDTWEFRLRRKTSYWQ